jgi:predicted nucleic acid-binding protein
MILVDANVLLDVWQADPNWQKWSTNQLRTQSKIAELAINPIIYAEISISFATPAALDARLDDLGIAVLSIPRHAAFLAGKAFVQYRRKGGGKSSVLADFFIGAHAAVSGSSILTRDTRRYSTYFPSVLLIAPPPAI